MFSRPPPLPEPDIEARVVRHLAAPFTLLAPMTEACGGRERGAFPRAAKSVSASRNNNSPIIATSPHSGRQYPRRFLEQAAPNLQTLRMVEDAGMDILLTHSPLPAPLLLAEFPRSFVDLNRHCGEIDPSIFQDMKTPPPTSNYIRWGLGVIPKKAAGQRDIYTAKLPMSEAHNRIRHYYNPFHDTLARLIAEAGQHHRHALLIDCHSMPSSVAARPGGIVIGDGHGHSAAPHITAEATAFFTAAGLRVTRNAPFAGGHITRHYGRPAKGVSALQVEICRSLYLDEGRVRMKPGWQKIAATLCGFIIHMDGVMADSPSAIAAE